MPSLISSVDYAYSSNWSGFALVSQPTARAFYSNTDPFHPTVAQAWLSNAPAASYVWVVQFGAGTWPQVETFAALDLRGYTKGVAQVASVKLEYDSGGGGAGPWIEVGTWTPDSRGDAFEELPSTSVLNWRYWRITVTMVDNTDDLRVGKFWLGNRLALPKTFAELAEEPEHNNIEQRTEGGGRFVSQLSDLASTLTMTWPRLTKVQRDALRRLVVAQKGAFKPLVIQPDAREAAFFHGRFSGPFQTVSDGISHGGAALTFIESGRGI